MPHFVQLGRHRIMQRNFRLLTILLVLIALSLSAGGKMNLCIVPDGDAHITRDSASCELFRECSPGSGELVWNNNSFRSLPPCLDIELGSDLSDPSNRNIVQIPPLTLTPIGLPIIPVPSHNKPFHVIPPSILPQIALQQSVVLLI